MDARTFQRTTTCPSCGLVYAKACHRLLNAGGMAIAAILWSGHCLALTKCVDQNRAVTFRNTGGCLAGETEAERYELRPPPTTEAGAVAQPPLLDLLRQRQATLRSTVDRLRGEEQRLLDEANRVSQERHNFNRDLANRLRALQQRAQPGAVAR